MLQCCYRLFKSGKKVIITEIADPLVIRRTVAFASAVYEGELFGKGVTDKISENSEPVFTHEYIPVIVDLMLCMDRWNLM